MFYDPQKTAYFKESLVRVVGKVLDAAGYQLEDNPLQQARGLIRYYKPLQHLGEDVYGFLEWQLLAFEESPIARFQLTLLRNRGLEARTVTDYSHRAEQALPWIIWHVFNARVVPADDSWWDFRNGNELLQALANAVHLLFGYGIPWLEMHQDSVPTH